MGELIDITPYLAERRRQREAQRWTLFVDEDLEIVSDVLDEMSSARADQACEMCDRRRAIAEVYRSDALDAGLGGMRQCGSCLEGELRHNRGAREAARACSILGELLAEAEGLARVEIHWDPETERAIALAGIEL